MVYVNKLIAGFIFLAVLSGCAIIPTQSPQETDQAIQMKAPDGKSLIYVVRPSRYSGAARTSLVYINNFEVGKLGSGHFFAIEVSPGKYTISTEITQNMVASYIAGPLNGISDALMSDKSGVTIDAISGEKYYVNLSMGVLGMNVKLADSSVFKKGTFKRPSLVSVLKLP